MIISVLSNVMAKDYLAMSTTPRYVSLKKMQVVVSVFGDFKLWSLILFAFHKL